MLFRRVAISPLESTTSAIRIGPVPACGAQHLPGDAVFADLEFAGREIDDGRAVFLRGGRHVNAPLDALGRQRRRRAERNRDEGKRGAFHGTG